MAICKRQSSGLKAALFKHIYNLSVRNKMYIDQTKLAQLRALISWARFTFNKAANLEISIWKHTTRDNDKIEYRIWIDSLFHKTSDDLDYLIYMIPEIKRQCLGSKELS